MFQTVPLSIIRCFSLYTQQWYMSYRFADSLQAESVPILLASCQPTCMTYTIAVCTVKNSDNGQRNCLKHVEFHSNNKFEKFVHLVGFIIRIYHDARSPERQKLNKNICQISQSWKQYSLGPFTLHHCLCVYQTHHSWGCGLKSQLTYKTLFFYQVLFYIRKLFIIKHVVSLFCWYLYTFKPHPQLPDLQ